jgi:hypothetical protein
MIEGLAEIPGLTCYGFSNPAVAFTLVGYTPHQAAERLSPGRHLCVGRENLSFTS